MSFTIDLDDPPFERWNQVAEVYGERLRRACRLMPVPSWIQTFINVGHHLGMTMYSQELKGIAHYARVPLGQLTALQLMLEASTGCTSYVNQMEDGVVKHFRTMDWHSEEGILEELCLTVEFVRDERVVARGVTWAGCVGLFTGVSAQGFGAALHYRGQAGGSYGSALWNVVSMRWPASYLMREVLLNCDLENALQKFCGAYLVSPCYVVVSSNTTAWRIVRDRDRCRVQEGLPLVQTNRDDDRDTNVMMSKQREELLKSHPTETDQALATFDRHPVTNSLTLYRCVIVPSQVSVELF